MIDRYKVNIVQSYHAGNWESPELIHVKAPEGEFVKYEDCQKLLNLYNKSLDLEDVKQLCRDYSSRQGSVYIKDVESALEGLLLQITPENKHTEIK